MDARTLSGLLATLVIVALAAVGLWAAVANYALESPGPYFLPTIATLALTIAFVFGLFVVGAKSDRWLRSPYW